MKPEHVVDVEDESLIDLNPIVKRGRQEVATLEDSTSVDSLRSSGVRPDTGCGDPFALSRLSTSTSYIVCSYSADAITWTVNNEIFTQCYFHNNSFINSFITGIYIAPPQGYYSEALATLARLKRTVFML